MLYAIRVNSNFFELTLHDVFRDKLNNVNEFILIPNIKYCLNNIIPIQSK